MNTRRQRPIPENCRYLVRVAPTPLIPVRLREDDPEIWCKLEFLNPSGSTKDRIARHMLEKAWRRGEIGPGSMVVEASSGSTSIALALACAQMGLRFVAVMPAGVSRERILMIRGYGGEVELIDASAGIAGAIAAADEYAAKHGAYCTRQFANPDNVEAHRIWTGKEIISQIPGGDVHGVVSGVGTGGTIVGLYLACIDAGCDTTAFVARPVRPICGGDIECCSFSGRVAGVVDGVSTIFREAHFDRVETLDVNDEEALDCARRLIRRGLPVGPSSGLNYCAAVAAARHLGSNAQVVTVLPDRMERYFSTELFERP